MLLWSQPRDRPYVVGVAVALFLCLGLLAWVLTVPLRAGRADGRRARDPQAATTARATSGRPASTCGTTSTRKRARIVELSGNADQQRNEMVRLAQDPDGVVDVYNLDVTWTAEFAENDYIVPLTGVSTDDFLSGPLDTCRYERRFDGIPFSGEKLWALPFNTDAGLLYYREGLVERPVDWDTVVDETRRVLGSPGRDPALEPAGPRSWTTTRASR